LIRIASVVARQLLDCKARPLVEVEITTDTGQVGRGASPTGSSVGVHEAFVLRDGDRAEYNGLSVHRAVCAVTDEIAPAIVGAELDDPRTLDQVMIELDGTPDKHRLGGNAIYSTSIALLRAASAAAGTPTHSYVGALLGLKPPTSVPAPSFNMINGGRYGDIFQTFNEFLVVPYRADSIESAVEKGVSLFGVLGECLPSGSAARRWWHRRTGTSLRPGWRIEKLNFLLRAAEGIPNCALADVPALVRF
jgi:enolase